jgi:transposase
MSQVTQLPNITVGLDLGDKRSQICQVDAAGACVEETTVATTPDGIARYFTRAARWRVVLEVGTHSPWIARQLEALGHEVFVANASAMYGHRRRRRNDRMDATFLARQGRADPALLHPIRHRRAQAQAHLEVLRARDQVVQARTKLINHVRGAVKPHGVRLRTCSAEAFPTRVAAAVPTSVRAAVTPLLELIAQLSGQIARYDATVRTLVRTQYPVAQRLQQPAGVGPVTALAFVLLVDEPARFAHSRDVGAYFGLVPRLDESSSATPQLRITKAGDALGRRLLVNAAHYILGRYGPDCALRRHGEAIAARGGKNAKKRAVIAVARKLAVLLHRLWVTDRPYDPNYRPARQAA